MTIFHHFHHHAKRAHAHVKKHHKHYLTGLFGSYALVKIAIFIIARLSFLPQFHDTFAENFSTCTLSGAYFTGTYQECTTGAGYWTGGEEICTTIQEGYYTGGILNESGELIDQTYVEPEQSCEFTGQTYIEGPVTCIQTGGFWTGGVEICPLETTGTITTTATSTPEDTGDNQLLSLNNGVCDAGDLGR